MNSFQEKQLEEFSNRTLWLSSLFSCFLYRFLQAIVFLYAWNMKLNMKMIMDCVIRVSGYRMYLFKPMICCMQITLVANHFGMYWVWISFNISIRYMKYIWWSTYVSVWESYSNSMFVMNCAYLLICYNIQILDAPSS